MNPLTKRIAARQFFQMLTVRRGVAFLLAALVFAGASPALAEVSLKFGIYASEKPSLLVKQFRPLLNYVELAMASDLGEAVHIELHVAPSYDEGIQALVDGQVDFSRLGPASYIKAKQRSAGIDLLVLENDGGDKYFNGVIFTRADSGVNSLADLKGKRFAFGDANSSSGRYLAQHTLVRAGISAKDLADYEYLGRHDRVAEAVWRGEFAAGAVKEDVFWRMVKEGRAIKSLADMKNVTGPWAARANLPARLSASLRRALLAISGPAIQASIGKQGFLPYVAGDLDLVRDAMSENHLFFTVRQATR
jgi:phosphonate transport system substrate-binding protein